MNRRLKMTLTVLIIVDLRHAGMQNRIETRLQVYCRMKAAVLSWNCLPSMIS